MPGPRLLPVPDDPINLSEYQPDWPKRFDIAARKLSSLLGSEFVVEHIGSTAVPDLAAKDCIDIFDRRPLSRWHAGSHATH